jgi:hypothetical protein
MEQTLEMTHQLVVAQSREPDKAVLNSKLHRAVNALLRMTHNHSSRCEQRKGFERLFQEMNRLSWPSELQEKVIDSAYFHGFVNDLVRRSFLNRLSQSVPIPPAIASPREKVFHHLLRASQIDPQMLPILKGMFLSEIREADLHRWYNLFNMLSAHPDSPLLKDPEIAALYHADVSDDHRRAIRKGSKAFEDAGCKIQEESGDFVRESILCP